MMPQPHRGLPIVRLLGRLDYLPTVQAMKAFTDERQPHNTPDEIWLCEHFPVFTQGVAGEARHLLKPGDIPVVPANRGGQVTYHGPGQVVAYPLIHLQRLGIFVKEYVYRLEHCILKTLEYVGVTGHRVPGAPGIYVRLDDPFSHAPLLAMEPRYREGVKGGDVSIFQGLGKIAALGIKVSRHCTYHGLALNVAMDLTPFSQINPCGYAGLKTIDLATLGIKIQPAEVADCLAEKLASHLSP
ncbi:MAG: lipoyl(octanoyl) transferase LipB [Burkholderiales bacterium]